MATEKHKHLNKQTRDRNIAISQKRKKPEEAQLHPDETKKLGLTKDEIKAKLKPVSKKSPKKKEKPKPLNYLLKTRRKLLH